MKWEAKPFICGCVNADKKGISYFGIGDSQDQAYKFSRGEVLGADVDSVIDAIIKPVLDDHMENDYRVFKKVITKTTLTMRSFPLSMKQW